MRGGASSCIQRWRGEAAPQSAAKLRHEVPQKHSAGHAGPSGHARALRQRRKAPVTAEAAEHRAPLRWHVSSRQSSATTRSAGGCSTFASHVRGLRVVRARRSYLWWLAWPEAGAMQPRPPAPQLPRAPHVRRRCAIAAMRSAKSRASSSGRSAIHASSWLRVGRHQSGCSERRPAAGCVSGRYRHLPGRRRARQRAGRLKAGCGQRSAATGRSWLPADSAGAVLRFGCAPLSSSWVHSALRAVGRRAVRLAGATQDRGWPRTVYRRGCAALCSWWQRAAAPAGEVRARHAAQRGKQRGRGRRVVARAHPSASTP